MTEACPVKVTSRPNEFGPFRVPLVNAGFAISDGLLWTALLPRSWRFDVGEREQVALIAKIISVSCSIRHQ